MSDPEEKTLSEEDVVDFFAWLINEDCLKGKGVEVPTIITSLQIWGGIRDRAKTPSNG